eukprot:4186348-Pyramimonas_sp.AAC.1
MVLRGYPGKGEFVRAVFRGCPGRGELFVACFVVRWESGWGNLSVWCCVDIMWNVCFRVGLGGYPRRGEIVVACVVAIYGSPVGGPVVVVLRGYMGKGESVRAVFRGYLGGGELVVACIVVIYESPVGGICLFGAARISWAGGSWWRGVPLFMWEWGICCSVFCSYIRKSGWGNLFVWCCVDMLGRGSLFA